MDREFYQRHGLGLPKSQKIFVDPPLSLLVELAVLHHGGRLSKYGALIVNTGEHRGRSANDKYVVKSPTTESKIWWSKSLNTMDPLCFENIKKKIVAYLNESPALYITERSVGAVEQHNIGVRLVTTHPQHALFSKYLFRYPLHRFGSDPRDFLILHAPELSLRAEEFGTRGSTVIATCFDTKITLIAGSLYAGEIKKSMFCVMNYFLPEDNILPMHTGASRLENGQSSLFFGLSGTGKTTLSTDEGTFLIGDDEHGLSPEGLFNFEGGCYAKTYKLSKSGEPAIFKAASCFGSILENVILTEKTGEPDYYDRSLTENGRCSYPLDFIDELEPSSKGKTPRHMFFLSADAFGVLPPVAKLSKEQAMFYFLLGYTAKVAGTEIGVQTPTATFSPCFGAPFMMRHPSVYADLLGHYLEGHDIHVWLINTGWTGGPYGVGQRFPLNITRQIIRTIQKNTLDTVPTFTEPLFGFEIPYAVRNVPTSFLQPQKNWPSPSEYEIKAKELARTFHEKIQLFSKDGEKMKGGPLYGGTP